MNKRTVSIGLFGVILLQLTVLTLEYVGAVYPLWTGEEIRLKTVPIDPRSLFRGNYARLNYDISRVKVESDSDELVRNGEVIYVSLKQNSEGFYEASGASVEKPEEGLFIRGRVKNHHSRSSFQVKYGIEAYFAPKVKALALEKQLRHGAAAIVMLADNGRATLKAIVDAPKVDQ